MQFADAEGTVAVLGWIKCRKIGQLNKKHVIIFFHIKMAPITLAAPAWAIPAMYVLATTATWLHNTAFLWQGCPAMIVSRN